MIVFGYAKDIAPINFIRLHINLTRLHPKAGREQRRAPHDLNQRCKDEPSWQQ